MKYRLIEQERGSYPVFLMCKLLSVSRQGYYQWRSQSHQRAMRADEERTVVDKIRACHQASRHTYGSPRITKDLRENGLHINKKRVARLMKVHEIIAKSARKFKATTNSSHNHPVAQNLLNREFSATAPNQKWVGDITYIWTAEGWLYLAVVIDLFSRKVVGWHMSHRMTSDIVCNALNMAVRRRKCSAPVLCHFDRGTQYASSLFQALLNRHGFICSMSRKANAWDNAVAESFFRTLKVEAIYGKNFSSRKHAKNIIFDWIETFYNTTRRHSTTNYRSPDRYEEEFFILKKTA